jgi:CheY-like chemotaxis protein
MPIMRGDAVVDSIRKHRPGIKALYITGSSEKLVAKEPVEVLLKPFKFPELGCRVRAILDSDLKLQKSAESEIAKLRNSGRARVCAQEPVDGKVDVVFRYMHTQGFAD